MFIHFNPFGSQFLLAAQGGCFILASSTKSLSVVLRIVRGDGLLVLALRLEKSRLVVPRVVFENIPVTSRE